MGVVFWLEPRTSAMSAPIVEEWVRFVLQFAFFFCVPCLVAHVCSLCAVLVDGRRRWQAILVVLVA